MKNHPLKFYQLAYKVGDITTMINSNDGIDYFVFSFYSAAPGLPLQLVAYAHTNRGYGNETHILDAYGHSVLEVSGPLILSNNLIPIDGMKDLIDYPNGSDSGYLVFTPVLNENNHVYYDVAPHDLTDGGAVKNPGSVTTNPSPPATMTVGSPYLV